jgi:C4-type Zn-finger protein
MYKPWPKCPKCASPMTLSRQRVNLQGEKEIALAPFECRSCDFSVGAVKPRPDTV